MSALTPRELFATCRRVKRDLLEAPDDEVEIPWLAMDDEHAETLAKAELGPDGPRLRRIDFAELESGRIAAGRWVVLLFGSREPDAEDARLLRTIRAREIAVHPLVLLGDDYFKVPEGEVFYYSQPLAQLRQRCGSNPVMALRCPRDLVPLSPRATEYFHALGVLALRPRFDRFEARLQAWKGSLAGVVEATRSGARPGPGVRTALLALLAARIEAIRLAVVRLLDPPAVLETAMVAALDALQRENQNEVVVERFGSSESSSLASDLVSIEILDLSRSLDTFLGEVAALDGDLAWLGKELEGLSSAAGLATTVAFVGPFSSGKTSLLNQLLWGRNRLRTSKGHNTAILCEIRHGESRVPQLELIWRREVRLEVLRPTDDFELALESPVSGRVGRVYHHQICSVLWIVDEMGRRCFVSLGRRSPTVAPGDVVRAGQPLTQGLSRRQRRRPSSFTSFDREEIGTLLSLLESRDLVQARVEVMASDGEEEVVSPLPILARLQTVAPLGEGTDLDPMTVERALRRNVISLTFTAKLHPEHGLSRGFPLDEKGWKYFQGEEGGTPFAERPAAYLLLERARIELSHDLLRLASIVDTPGLGSLTDRHDETTEKFLRSHAGLIVLFVRMDHQWQQQSFWRLFDLVESLPEEKTRDNVLVLCNWWRQQMPPARLERDMKKLRILLGDRFPEIFVFDLYRLLERGEMSDRVGDFGTFAEMRDLLRRRVQELGPGRRLRDLQQQVHDVFQRAVGNLRAELDSVETSEETRSRRLRMLQACLARIPAGPSSPGRESADELRSYRPIVALLDNQRSWRDNRDALLSTARAINAAVADPTPGQLLLLPLAAIAGELQRLSLRVAFPELPAPPAGSLPVHALTEKIDSIIRDWPWITLPIGTYRGLRRQELESWFDAAVGALLIERAAYHTACREQIDAFHRSARETVQKALAALQPGDPGRPAALRGQIARIRREILPRWRKLSETIDHVLEGG